jgi:hypothetical protein
MAKAEMTAERWADEVVITLGVVATAREEGFTRNG